MSRIDEAIRFAAAAKAGSDPGSELVRLRDRTQGASGAIPAPVSLEDYPCEGGGSAVVPVVSRELPVSSIAAPRAGALRPLANLGAGVEGKLVTDAETSLASIEQYRRLAATLHQLQVQSGLKKLMVSSALPRDGKTLTAANLALTLSESYKRNVLLIDADFRRPGVHEVFRLPNNVGLAEGLLTGSTSALPLLEVSPRLTVLPAGRPDSAPMAGLTSERMRMIVQEAAARFDWVILDTPPVGLISDANLLASLVDGVLLVIGAGWTDCAAAKRAVGELGRDRILGVVLNRIEAVGVGSNGYYKQYYGSRASPGDAGANS